MPIQIVQATIEQCRSTCEEAQQEFQRELATLRALCLTLLDEQQLAAVAAGLGSAWVGFFSEERVTEILDLDPRYHPVALLTIGYPAELPEPSPRRPMSERVSRR
jgi:nitroreductase